MQRLAIFKVGALGISLLLVGIAVADDTSTARARTAGLTPAQRDGVQHVGQALLLAKRTAETPADLVALRTKVEEFQTAIADLRAPVRATKLTLTNAPAAVVSPAKDWRETRSADIGRVYQAAAALRQRARASAAAAIPFGDNSAMEWIYDTLPDGGDDVVVGGSTIATRASRQRIEHLQSDIDAALVLSVAKRQQRLAELADEFQLRKTPRDSRVRAAGEREDAPTLSIRTEHRRATQ